MQSPTPLQETMFAQRLVKEIFEEMRWAAYEYMDSVDQRSVFPTENALEKLQCFDEPFPEVSQDGIETLRMLHHFGSPATIAQTGGRYFGFVNGNAIPTAVAARWLSDVWDQNTALHVMSPIAAKLEQVCERWVVDLLGLSAETVAGFVSGTSIATTCGLAAGRYALLKKQGWDVNEDGLFGAPPIRVVVSEQAHGTVFKALSLLGLGRKRVELAPADDQGRIDPSQLPELDANTLVILQAGHVSTGAFDAFETICQQAQAADAWVHIDGAFGLWAAASPKLNHLTKGIDLADSWSVDCHKTLNTPYDGAIVLCKHRDMLVAAMQATGAYIQWGAERDNMMFTPEMSRRARAVEVWAALRFLGRSGLASMVEELCNRAQQFGDLLSASGFNVRNDVVYNQVLVQCDSAEQTAATMVAIQASGECWCGGTQWNGEPAIRISVCSWATTSADVERSVQAFIAARQAASIRT